MPRNRFQTLLKLWHFNDNDNEPGRDSPNHDRLSKIRPVMDHLFEMFQVVYTPGKLLACDERATGVLHVHPSEACPVWYKDLLRLWELRILHNYTQERMTQWHRMILYFPERCTSSTRRRKLCYTWYFHCLTRATTYLWITGSPLSTCTCTCWSVRHLPLVPSGPENPARASAEGARRVHGLQCRTAASTEIQGTVNSKELCFISISSKYFGTVLVHTKV